jgi:hypothetical protein
MNRFLFLPLCFALITDAYAQGTVLFYNHVPTIGLDAPVFDVGGQNFLAGYPFFAQLYAGPAASSLTPIGFPLVFQTGPGAGHWTAGFDGGYARIITTVAPGDTAFVQVRAFSVVTGQNYEDVLARGGRHGESLVFSVITGGDTKNGTQPPSLPAYLTGLQSFSLTGVDPVPAAPEPTTTALLLTGGLIAGVLRYRSRRRETARPVRGQR